MPAIIIAIYASYFARLLISFLYVIWLRLLNDAAMKASWSVPVFVLFNKIGLHMPLWTRQILNLSLLSYLRERLIQTFARDLEPSAPRSSMDSAKSASISEINLTAPLRYYART